MYGLDVGTDLTPLTGCSLESIDMTLHQLQLRLDSLNGIRLSIESDFSIGPSGGAARTYDRPPEAAQALADLLGVEVVAAEVTEPGTVTLRWADGSALQVFDSNEHYESYQIYLGERLIVV
jgi:hypothetical protein